MRPSVHLAVRCFAALQLQLKCVIILPISASEKSNRFQFSCRAQQRQSNTRSVVVTCPFEPVNLLINKALQFSAAREVCRGGL